MSKVIAVFVLIVSITLAIIEIVRSTITDDEKVIDFERLQDLRERACYEVTYFGKVSEDTEKELKELESKYGVK